MFRRKEEGLFDNNLENGEEQMENAHEEQAVSTQSTNTQNTTASQQASFSASGSSAARSTTAPTAGSFRPAATAQAPTQASAARTPEKMQTPSSPAISSIASAIEKSKSGKRVLTVGNDILLKGEIATCDRLVIDGRVDATLNDVHTVEISETGSFKGAAQIENAEIRGLFEGDLTVRGLLVIYATGKVRGNISYGEIEIERGGEFTGEIKIVGAAPNTRQSSRNDKVAA